MRLTIPSPSRSPAELTNVTQDNSGTSVKWCKQQCNSVCVAVITVPIMVGIILIGAGIWFCRRRCQRQRMQGQTAVYVPNVGVLVNGVMMQPVPAVYLEPMQATLPTVGYPAQFLQPQWNQAGPGAGPQYAQVQQPQLFTPPPGQQKAEQQYALR